MQFSVFAVKLKYTFNGRVGALLIGDKVHLINFTACNLHGTKQKGYKFNLLKFHRLFSLILQKLYYSLYILLNIYLFY